MRPPDGNRTDAAVRQTRLALGQSIPLRVAFAGGRARPAIGGGVDAVRLGEGDAMPEVDLLVIEPDAGDALAQEASAAGIPVIGFDRDGAGHGAWSECCELVCGAPGPGSLAAGPSLDPHVFNPLGFRPTEVAGLASIVSREDASDAVEAARATITRAAQLEPLSLLTAAGVPLPLLPPGARRVGLSSPLRPRETVRKAQERLGVLDHPAFHPSEYERAGWLAKLCASGVPVAAVEISDELAELLGPELAGLLEPIRPRDLADPDLRERLSVALRRTALREHSAEARWRAICAEAGIELPGRPMVSVIFSTRRASWLEHGIAQIQRQSYEPRELVVCLHGDEFDAGTEQRIRSLYDGALQVVHVDGDLTLGDALNAGVETSEGELVTKMDDDDYYNVDHLWDLVLALDYARADLVGKAAEFVYLEEIDVTVRQISQDVQTRMAGGGMMARKGPLQAIGGWPSRSRGEDLALIRSFAGAERPIHRIPPHGYILNRHGRDHTWRPQVDYFLFRSEAQRRGLDWEVTAIERPTDPYSRIPAAGADEPLAAGAQSSG